MLRLAGVKDPAVEQAFAAVPREVFLGPPPWHLVNSVRPRELHVEDADLLYRDVLIALDLARGVNNGSPSLHALMLHELGVQPGHSVVHVGAGTGYYTAILSHLVGPDGRVLAIEYDAALAERARGALADYANVTVRQGDGTQEPAQTCDRIYVNFGIPYFPAPWIEQLAPQGRLVLPLCAGGPRRGSGIAFVVERLEAGYAARQICPVSFICVEGTTTAHDDEALQTALMRGGSEFVRSLIWRRLAEPRRCWLYTPGWSLSYDLP